MGVSRYRSRSRDDLSVLVSLTMAIGILVSAVATMWIWSIVPHRTTTPIVQNASEIP